MARYRVVLLDFDVTLVATRPAVVACLGLTLAAFGTAASEEACTRLVASGATLAETFAALDPTLTMRAIDDQVRHYRRLYPEIDAAHSLPFETVAATLQRVADFGIDLIVLSNKGQAAVETALHRFGLSRSVAHVLADTGGLPTKPDPAAFDLRVTPLYPGLSRTQFLMVGDTVADLRFAKSAEIDACWASYGYGDEATCRACEPAYVLSRFSDLAGLFASETASIA